MLRMLTIRELQHSMGHQDEETMNTHIENEI